MPPDALPRIVIVDGYATGRELLHELLERNVECLHLRSSAGLPALVAEGFDPRPYDGDLGHVGEVRAAMRLLSELQPDAVVAGSEWGVTFAERAAHGLGLPTNTLETLTARRDKFAMTEAVRRAGLSAPDHLRSASIESAHAWAERRGVWPIIVKPLASTGSDGVSLSPTMRISTGRSPRPLGRRI
jgi:hypothetical protein